MRMLTDKVILLTGAAGNIGSETAKLLAGYHAKLVLCDINAERLQELRREICDFGEDCEIFAADVTDYAAMQEMAKFAYDRFGRIDVMVNNAGGSAGLLHKISDFADADMETLQFVINLNVFGTFNCCKAVLPYMKEQMKGKIINFSSVAGVAGLAKRADYSAAKGAIISFTKALAMEVGKYYINVNCIAPGAVPHNHIPMENATYYGPNGTSGTPRDIGEMVAFLASEKSNYIQGETILVDGGRTLGCR